MPEVRRGFSLIEMMIVVAIIGILATLAYPSLEAYLLRTRQSEAQTTLSAIYTAQKIHYATQQAYATTLDALDVKIESAAVYLYTLSSSASGFTATATANLDDDAALDTWTIDQDKTLQNTINDITSE
ncbi:MAG: type IV pilin protein [bacterium]|jgi:prepilin-type N-terminal cleavage/methylation domain-containing protein